MDEEREKGKKRMRWSKSWLDRERGERSRRKKVEIE